MTLTDWLNLLFNPFLPHTLNMVAVGVWGAIALLTATYIIERENND